MKFWEKYSLNLFNKNIVKDLPLMPQLPSVVKYNTTYGNIEEFNQVCETFLIDYHKKEIINSLKGDSTKAKTKATSPKSSFGHNLSNFLKTFVGG